MSDQTQYDATARVDVEDAQLSVVERQERPSLAKTSPDAVVETAVTRRPYGARTALSRRPAMLEGVKMPTHSKAAKAAVFLLYHQHPALTLLDLPAATRHAELAIHYRRLSQRVARDGVETKDGKLRQIVTEMRQVADALLRHETALGLTPTSRAALGVDLGRLRDLDLPSQHAGERR